VSVSISVHEATQGLFMQGRACGVTGVGFDFFS
jgi:hypothetical protein